jgi:hypothetical protein
MRGGAVQGSPEKVAVLGAPAKKGLSNSGARCGCQGESPSDRLDTFLSICHPSPAPSRVASRVAAAEEVDEDKERHRVDWQGTKQSYQLELTPSISAIRAR